MTAIGIDLGGTKIECQVFADDWSVQDRHRVETPADYDTLVAAIRDLITWGAGAAGATAPVGIGAAGLINPADGTALTANLPATGKPIPADISAAVGRPVTYINDCRALALSEAVFGAGKPYRTVMSLILGTGVGGGLAIDGQLLTGPTRTGGEYGHVSAPAHLVARHNLPILSCGCGRMGCIETLISGTGLARIGQITMGRTISAPDLVAARATDPQAQAAWDIWCDLTADLICAMVLTVDPDCIVLGGGLSRIPDLATDLTQAAQAAQLPGFDIPPILLAEGGDTSGARGAAYAASQGMT